MIHITFCLAAMIYALTGGPSSGKTSIIKELEEQGESVIHEAATDWIIKKMDLGVSEPWKEESFLWDILTLQLDREKPWLHTNRRVFVDRGIFDVYSFAMTYNLAGTKTLIDINKILNKVDINERYKAIFFIKPYCESFTPHQTAVRRENVYEAEKLEVATYAIYCRHENFIVVPGGMSTAERADFILKKVKELE